MELQKFYCFNTHNTAYVVTGTDVELNAFEFVKNYKKISTKEMYDYYVCLYGIVRNNELYITDSKKNSNCFVVVKTSVAERNNFYENRLSA